MPDNSQVLLKARKKFPKGLVIFGSPQLGSIRISPQAVFAEEMAIFVFSTREVAIHSNAAAGAAARGTL